MHFSHLGTNLKITSWKKSGPWIDNHSQRAIFISPLSYNPWPAKCCLSGPNWTTGFFARTVKWCTCLIAYQQPISIMTECLNLWQDGANVSTLMGNMMKKMTIRWNNWPTFEVVMTSHWFSELMKPYWLHIPCRFQQRLTAVVQKLWTHKK